MGNRLWWMDKKMFGKGLHMCIYIYIYIYIYIHIHTQVLNMPFSPESVVV